MNEWSKIIVYILSGSGLVTALITLFKQRTIMKWSNRYQRQIESLKGDIHKNNEIMNSSLNIFSQGYNQAQEKRSAAIEEMWDKVLKIRESSSKIVTFYTLFLPEEYNNEENMYLTSLKMHLPSEEELVNFIGSMDELEKKRPYLGEKLWILFTIYRAFSGRLVIIFKRSVNERNIKRWHQDRGLMQLLEAALTKKEYEEYTRNKLGQHHSLTEAINIIEQKILKEFNNTLSGTYASEESFQQARKIQNLLSELEQGTKI
ncbi:hypothetical protein QNH36_19265 [Mesobacillus sp. AQ2]|jgi:hypothetical protein|uniref:hypothetical protein n=1 Tax=Bacillaceae TaxID=186817 RepID=UPI0011A002DE|nr:MULTISPECIES: hypothetical protein [Bacillaceae]MCM3576416.1 hypothetical protein [Mesobacillus subterraneus]WHX39767.1 hypothetical protein QNH36_19265 [Mesobacillus sp. AQ2]